MPGAVDEDHVSRGAIGENGIPNNITGNGRNR